MSVRLPDLRRSCRVILLAFGIAGLVAGISCLKSNTTGALLFFVSDASAQDTAVIFGRVLSGPGTMSQNMPAPSPRGVAGVNVSLSEFAGGKVISTAISGSDGSFRFTVPPGDYTIKGAGNPRSFHVDAGEQRQVDLQLPNP
jgi:hypothetical protein